MIEYLKTCIRRFIPHYINRIYIRTYLYSLIFSFNNALIKRNIRSKKTINVGFVIMTHAMWKEEELYQLFSNDSKFNPYIILSPTPRLYKDNESYSKEIEQMKDIFNIDKYNVLTYEEYVLKAIHFDILFYQQPYEDGFMSQLHPLALKKTLTCYIPYSIPTLHLKYDYEHLITNIAWKFFIPTESHKEMIKKLSINNGKNLHVTGYPSADYFIFCDKTPQNYWKDKSHHKKRIIWAPHHSISSKNKNIHQGTFLEYYTFMIELAEKYKNHIEIAFNPHPLLLQVLKEKEGWSDADIFQYMEKWRNLKNGIVTLDNYMDVFKTSDALIHDCASFTIEYLYTQKPVMFLCKGTSDYHMNRLCKLAQKAFKAHYKATNKSDIENFIVNILLNGDDSKKEERKKIYTELVPPNNISASQNIFQTIKKQLT